MTHRGAWNSRWSFVLATTGSAIGLGNIWKLPYMIGVNGGSAFVLIYILSILCVGIPLLMTEIMLGRRVQKNPIDAMKSLAKESSRSNNWKYVGGMGMLTGVMILCFYSVVGGYSAISVLQSKKDSLVLPQNNPALILVIYSHHRSHYFFGTPFL